MESAASASSTPPRSASEAAREHLRRPPPPQWAPVASRMKRRENGPQPRQSPSPQDPPHAPQEAPLAEISPAQKLRKTMPQLRRLEAEADVLTPSRRPLGDRALNTPGSPAVGANPDSPGKGRSLLSKRFSPFVDILVVDDQGQTISRERRVSGPIDTDSEDDLPSQPKPPRRLRRLASARVDSDDSDLDASPVCIVASATPIPAAAPGRGRLPKLQMEVVLPLRSQLSWAKPAPSNPPAPVVISPRPITPPLRPSQPEPTLRYQHFASPIPRARQLTPIRGRGRGLYAPPSPPSPLTPTDSDLTLDLSDLSILSLSPHAPGRPSLRTSEGFRKIGEASYSEVFGIGDVVLKVIPLRDEARRRLRRAEEEEEGPAETDAKDVLKEIIVTHAMGEVCDGFVKLLRTYVVKGTYPQVLLELWDEYYQRKGSEGVRPGICDIVLPNGGPDLEAYTFKSAPKGGWKQACSVFWQVAKALAHAETLVSFEHRDLHLGQILVKEVPVTAASQPLQALNQNRKAIKAPRAMMDDAVHGVRATLIDLGLSRMDAGDGSGGEKVHWTPFEEEIFMGEGDYQFDIYRYMRDHNGDNWEAFNPLTNVLWLHYLAVKLLKSKGLKAPARRKSQAPAAPGAGFTERDCYECMVDLEDWLRHCVAAVVSASSKAAAGKGKGRKKKPAVVPHMPGPGAALLGPLCAGEVVGYGAKKGWVTSLAWAPM
ncbi:hypothetical protein B0H17DRAFT_1214644 [Mycena rosella]|uniref:non-specific serine/threonine protein kinase n=1 Tax=Mycena rosella TaxID=1033263 RepID=A0AAD7CMK3_MYCRO|nr:hypothetical protein B0H17DRAFT_1214644 [Mycena rosella]